MAGNAVGPVDPKNHVASVEKAVRLLELFGDETPQLTLAEVIKRGGYARTTTHACSAPWNPTAGSAVAASIVS